MSVEIGINDDADAVVEDVAKRLSAQVQTVLEQSFPAAFWLAQKNNVPVDEFTVHKTEVIRTEGGW